MSKSKIIALGDLTDRQNWAAGALAERFFKANRLTEVSNSRDNDAREFLTTNGFNANEVEPIIEHMNGAAEVIRGMDSTQQERINEILDMTIAEGRHKPPAPQ